MNMPRAADTIPDRTARTVMTTRTRMCAVTGRPRSNRPSTSRPSTATTSEEPSAIESVASRSDILVPVPDAPDGQDPLRLGRVVLDLFPEPSHVDGHGRLVTERPAPDVLEEFGAAEDPAGVTHEEHEQIELPYGQRDVPLAQPDDAAGDVHGEVAVDQRLGRRRGGRPGWRRPAQHGTDPQYELARRERLGHVVVGADLEPEYAVGLLAERGQHHHRQRRVECAHAPAHLKAVDARQHQV